MSPVTYTIFVLLTATITVASMAAVEMVGQLHDTFVNERLEINSLPSALIQIGRAVLME